MPDELPSPALILAAEGHTEGPIGHETAECDHVLTFSTKADLARTVASLCRMDEAFVVVPQTWTVYASCNAVDQLRTQRGFRVERR